jgi:hypothetical protein
MKQYAFVLRVVSKERWVVEAETLEDAGGRLKALRDEGELPVEEEVEGSEIITVLEDGVAVPPPGKKRYHVEVETREGSKHYEVFAADKYEAQNEGVDQFLDQNPDQDFLTISAEEPSAGEAEAAEKAWQFHLDVIGYGEDPEEAWGDLLLYSLKEPPPCERLPDKDVRPEEGEQRNL